MENVEGIEKWKDRKYFSFFLCMFGSKDGKIGRKKVNYHYGLNCNSEQWETRGNFIILCSWPFSTLEDLLVLLWAMLQKIAPLGWKVIGGVGGGGGVMTQKLD